MVINEYIKNYLEYIQHIVYEWCFVGVYIYLKVHDCLHFSH